MGCPTEAELRKLCVGDISAEQEKALTEHVDQCETCQAAIERFSSPFVDSVQVLAEANVVGNSVLLRERLGKLKIQRPSPQPGTVPQHQDLQPWIDEGDTEIGRVGHYDLIRCIGRGGMGVVFEAFDRELQRPVAVKMMSPALLTEPANSKRFLREARAAAGINHPNVVSVYAVEQIRELPYLVMELVEGESLAAYVQRVGRVPMENVISIAGQISNGLAAAHVAGVVHRDVKPANILLDSAMGNAKLTDFGLARSTEGSSATQSGLLLGTPTFAAPEQIDSTKPFDHRADLFSLGSVLYLLCSGQAPFAGPSLMSILHEVCSKAPTPVESLNPQTPDWLATLIHRLHAKDPKDRFESARIVAEIISSHQSAGVSTTRRYTKQTSAADSSMRRRLAWVFTTVSAIAIVSFLAFMFRPNRTGTRVGTEEQLLAMLESEEDYEIVLTSEEYFLPPIEIEGREVRLTAARGIRPSLHFESDEPVPALNLVDSIVHLQGIDIVLSDHDEAFDEEDEDEELEENEPLNEAEGHELRVEDLESFAAEEDEDDEEEDLEETALVQCDGGEFTSIDCRLLNHRGSCIAIEGGRCELIDSELNGPESPVIWWVAAGETALSLTNCVVAGETGVAIEGAEDTELTAESCTFVGMSFIGCMECDIWEGSLTITTQQCVFDVEDAMIIADGLDLEDPPVRWIGSANVLPTMIVAAFEDEQGFQIRELAEWQALDPVSETGSRQFTPTYEIDREVLLDRLAEGDFSDGDLELIDDSNLSAGARLPLYE